MKKQDVNILREIQKKTEAAIKSIDTISDKVYDDRLATEIAQQSVRYAEIHNDAVRQLVEAKAETYRATYIEDIILKMGIHGNTMLDTSTGHIAELMIRGNNTGILDMEKVLRHNQEADKQSIRMARDLISFEQKNIGVLKDFL